MCASGLPVAAGADAVAGAFEAACETDGGGLATADEAAYDALLVKQCAHEWTSAVDVVVALLARDLHVGDMVLLWRLRALVAKGVLDKRGRGRFQLRHLEVRLRA